MNSERVLLIIFPHDRTGITPPGALWGQPIVDLLQSGRDIYIGQANSLTLHRFPWLAGKLAVPRESEFSAGDNCA